MTHRSNEPHLTPRPRRRRRRPASGTSAPAQRTTAPLRHPSPPAADDGRIAIDDFMRVELRVAKVLEAEAVPKSKKSIKMKVDVGTEQRTIVAGIAEAYQPDQLVGRTIVIVANLKPAKLMGIESNGMVLRGQPGGRPAVLVAVDPHVRRRAARVRMRAAADRLPLPSRWRRVRRGSRCTSSRGHGPRASSVRSSSSAAEDEAELHRAR